MNRRIARVAILGSTGSIGRSTLEVIESAEERLQVVGLTAHRNLDLLGRQAARHHPRWIVVSDPAAGEIPNLPPGTRVERGPEAMEAAVVDPDVDVVVAAIVGSAGLRATWAAIKAGKRVALANKETLVVAGEMMTELARGSGAVILPVDSEHSAVFQGLRCGRREELQHIVLTASGGPFLRHTPEQLAQVTVADALAHPTWNMGRKITVDSATMMNKALEIIEARWLFDVRPEQIKVVIHPQSVVHSFVEFIDGSVIAQLSPPDMKLPIQYALTWPERKLGPATQLDWSERWRLEFEPPDLERFPALGLGWECARAGGTAGAVVNAANEAAVAAFLGGEMRFNEIVPTCRRVLEHHDFEARPTLERLLEMDRWARQEVTQWKNSSSARA